MNFLNSAFKCVICYNDYDTKQRRPCIGQCGHSICQSCKHQLTTTRCPQCNRDEAFAVTTINYQVLEQMKTMSRTSITSSEGPSSSLKKVVKNRNKEQYFYQFGEGQCSECGSSSKRLRICINCGIADRILIRRDKQLSLNLEGITVEEAIKRAKRNTICADCALENHDDHETMKFAVLMKDLDDIMRTKLLTHVIEMKASMNTSLVDFAKMFDDTYEGANKLLQMSNSCSNSDRRPHYSNVGMSLKNISSIDDAILNATLRLEATLRTIKLRMSLCDKFGLTYKSFEYLEIAGSSFIAVENDGFENNLNSIAEGSCSQCGVHDGALCLCAKCATTHNILVRSENGATFTLNLNTSTVEVAIKRIQNSPICRDCALRFHEGHACLQYSEKVQNWDGIIHNSLQLKINNMMIESKKSLEDFRKVVKDVEETLKTITESLKNRYNIDKDLLYSYIEIDFQVISSIYHDMLNENEKLKATNDDMERQAQHIEQTGGAVLRNSTNSMYSAPLIEKEQTSRIDNNSNH